MEPPDIRGQWNANAPAWLDAVLGAGQCVEAVAEPRADEQTATDHPEVADTRIVPYFLQVRARKP